MQLEENEKVSYDALMVFANNDVIVTKDKKHPILHVEHKYFQDYTELTGESTNHTTIQIDTEENE